MYRFFQKNIVLFLMLINIVFLLTEWSASLINVLFFFLVLLGFIFKPSINIEHNKNKILGLDFFLFFLFCNVFGFVYGYSYKYVLITIAIIIPVFSAYFINEKRYSFRDVTKYMKIFAVITAAMSILMFFYWQNIGFLKYIVNRSTENGGEVGLFSNFYTENGQVGRLIRATGVFKNAFVNGGVILGGVILVIEDMILKRHSLLRNLSLLIILGISVYTTQTRNVYFLCVMIFVGYALLSFYKKYTNMYFLVLCIAYITTFMGGIVFALSMSKKIGGSINSLFSRFYSWNIIYHDYLVSRLGTWNAWMGYGLIQFESDFAPPKTYWMIDNSFLMVFMGAGLIGVFLFFRWQIRVFNFLLKTYHSFKMDKKLKSYIRITILLLTLYFMGGVMNANVYNNLFLLPILLLIKKTYTSINKRQSYG